MTRIDSQFLENGMDQPWWQRWWWLCNLLMSKVLFAPMCVWPGHGHFWQSLGQPVYCRHGAMHWSSIEQWHGWCGCHHNTHSRCSSQSVWVTPPWPPHQPPIPGSHPWQWCQCTNHLGLYDMDALTSSDLMITVQVHSSSDDMTYLAWQMVTSLVGAQWPLFPSTTYLLALHDNGWNTFWCSMMMGETPILYNLSIGSMLFWNKNKINNAKWQHLTINHSVTDVSWFLKWDAKHPWGAVVKKIVRTTDGWMGNQMLFTWFFS